MAKFFGKVGYGEAVETPVDSGIWIDTIIDEREYQGDVTQITRSLVNTDEKVNPDISVGNLISIVADEFAFSHFYQIKYVEWSGTLWTVDKIEVRRPRLIFSLGSVYNGPTP